MPISYNDAFMWATAQTVITDLFATVLQPMMTRTYLGYALGLFTAAAIAFFLWRWLSKAV